MMEVEKKLVLFDGDNPTDVKESAMRVYAGIVSGNLGVVAKSQHFQVLLNQEPPKKWLAKHPYVKVKDSSGHQVPYTYVPIARLEMLLNRLFFGEWSTRNFRWERHFNELVGSIDLVLTHPMTGREIVRTGAASVVIMQDKDAELADFNNTKKKNALETVFPKLKAQCFTNACKSLGNVFGGNLNRGTDDVLYVPLIDDDKMDRLEKQFGDKEQ